MSKLQEYLRDINAKADEVKALFDASDTRGGEMPDGDRERVKALNKEIEQLEMRAADTQEWDAVRAQSDERSKRGREPVAIAQPAAEVRQRAQSLGERFTDSEEWKGYFKQIAPTGQVGNGTRVQSPTLLIPTGFKALVTGTTDTSGGAFVVPDQSGIYETLGRRPLTLRDIISVRTTASDLVEYVRMTSHTNVAAAVAEATATAGGSGYKPEGDFAFLRVQAPVKTIAEWVAATKRSLSDAGQIRGIIDQELRADLEEELEDQLLNGDNVGENFEGLTTVSGTQVQAWSVNALQTTRKARTLVRTVGRSIPTAYVMNPADWETMDLLQDNEARYYFGGPSVLGTPRLWGLPVIESEAQTAGFAWVGDWRKLVLWDREQAQISVSDSHLDFFVRNMVAILAEMRAAMGVIRPTAFVEADIVA